MKPIVFYDGDCGLCAQAVVFFLRRDSKKRLYFAPLNGKTANQELHEWLQTHAHIDSMVLLEQNETSRKAYYWSQAVFRTCWYLGSFWSLVGLLSFLPAWMLAPFDICYRFIAKRRRSICLLPRDIEWQKSKEDQFLP